MTTPASVRTIRIFVSSPSDVAEERDRAKQVIEGLRRRYSRNFILKPVLWEDLALQAEMSFQEGIERVLSHKQGIDLAVFILWSRLGSPVGPQIVKEDGTEYLSGTERELYLMRKAHRQSGEVRPTILIYTRKDEKSFEERLRGKPTSEKEELVAQKRLVESFIDEVLRDSETGHNKCAYHSFDRPVTFSQRLRIHLIELLDQLAGEATETVWDIDRQGPPYLGLSSFQPEHADVFFGREEEILEIRFALREQAKQACAFLLLMGASGSGKSSLAMSGVLPDILQNELDDQVASWRWLIVTPSRLAPDPVMALLEQLVSPEVFPELEDGKVSLEQLARGLRESPQLTFELGIQTAINSLSELAGGRVRLLIVIDQMEEMFASHVMTPEDRDAFLGVIETFCSSGDVWVLATARSDFFHKIQDEPRLIRLLESRGPMLVMPPSPDGLQRLIEEPARLAGLRFEQKNGVSLSSIILRDAARHAELLPLLEFVLRELFESCKENGILTFAAYEGLGGIEGALGVQAEGMFQDLPVESQSALSEILPLLVTLEIAGEQPAVRRRSSLDELRSTPAREVLINQLIENRFLTTDRQENISVASFAHEALLRRWERIVHWIQSNREHLRIRSRILASVTNWEKNDRRKDLLLSAGKPLDDAQELSSSGILLEKVATEFIEQSRIRVRTSSRLRRLAVASLGILTILSVIASGVAWRAQQKATASLEQVVESEAEVRRKLYDNSIAIAEREITSNHDFDLAADLLSKSSIDQRGWEWNYLSRRLDGPMQPLKGHSRGLWTAEFSPNGNEAVTASIDGTVKVWNVETLTVREDVYAQPALVLPLGLTFPIGWLKDVLEWLGLPSTPIMCATFSPDGSRIASGGFAPKATVFPLGFDLRASPGVVTQWDTASGKRISDYSEQIGIVMSVAYSPDGTYVASSTICPDNTFHVWNSSTLETRKIVGGHKSTVHRLRFSPDGKFILSADSFGVLKVWDSETFSEFNSVQAHGAPIIDIAVNPSCSQLATASQDGNVSVWTLPGLKKVRQLKGHLGAALGVCFSPDGQLLASGGYDKTVRVWDANSGEMRITLRGHTDVVWSVVFSPDSTKILSASFDETARIWDASIRKNAVSHHLASLDGHADKPNCVRASPDGEFWATTSWDHSIRLWDSSTGELKRTIAKFDSAAWGLEFSPSRNELAASSWDGTVQIRNYRTNELVAKLTEHTSAVHCLAYDADGSRLATGSFDGQVKIWDTNSWQSIATCDGFILPVYTVAFSADGKSIFSGGTDQRITMWNAATGKRVRVIGKHNAAVHDLAVSTDGQFLYSAGWDDTIKIWDVSSGKRAVLIATLDEHNQPVNSITLSPDQKCLVSASDDKTVRFWDARNGSPIAPPLYHRGAVWSVGFNPVKNSMATACWSTRVGVQVHDWSLLVGAPNAR